MKYICMHEVHIDLVFESYSACPSTDIMDYIVVFCCTVYVCTVRVAILLCIYIYVIYIVR